MLVSEMKSYRYIDLNKASSQNIIFRLSSMGLIKTLYLSCFSLIDLRTFLALSVLK